MKRFAWLLLIAILSFSSLGSAPPAPAPSSPLAESEPALPEAGIPGYNVVCGSIRATRVCASVSQQRVIPGSFVTIYGSMKTRGVPVKGVFMHVVWHSSTSTSCVGMTDDTGVAYCTTFVPARMSRGYRVNVIVHLDKYKVNTYFRTKDTNVEAEED